MLFILIHFLNIPHYIWIYNLTKILNVFLPKNKTKYVYWTNKYADNQSKKKLYFENMGNGGWLYQSHSSILFLITKKPNIIITKWKLNATKNQSVNFTATNPSSTCTLVKSRSTLLHSSITQFTVIHTVY